MQEYYKLIEEKQKQATPPPTEAAPKKLTGHYLEENANDI